ncbi:MAG TPA: hypothetical protein VM638_09240, partial [Actinomycetota bacterium]|nr:hypothetical protein [Actinomycetota bacterium]
RVDLSGYLALHVNEVRPDGSARVTATMQAPSLVVNGRSRTPRRLRTTMLFDRDGLLVKGGTFTLPQGLVARIVPIGLAPPRPPGEIAPGRSWSLSQRSADAGTTFRTTGQASFSGYEDDAETVAILDVRGRTRVTGGTRHPRGRYRVQESVGLDHRAGEVRWLRSVVDFDLRVSSPVSLRASGFPGVFRGSGNASIELSPV